MFKKYSSIENHYQTEFIDRVLAIVPKWIKYHVSEKIHWANFSVSFDRDLNFKVFSRNGAVEAGAFNWEKVFINTWLVKKLETLASEIFSDVTNDEFSYVQFTGEIFWGGYNGKTDKGASKVNKWVDYTPFNTWAMFDIMLLKHVEVTEYHPEWLIGQYLDAEFVEASAEKYDILTAPLIGIFDTLEEAMAIDVDTFESIVYKEFWLEKIENNIAEWVVIKPFTGDYRAGNGERLIIKKKGSSFKEKSHKQKVYVEVVLSPEVEYLLNEATAYINDNRVESAKSKYDPTSADFIGKVIGEFSKDVFTEVNKDFESEIGKLEDEDKKIFRKQLSSLTIPFVRKNLLWQV